MEYFKFFSVAFLVMLGTQSCRDPSSSPVEIKGRIAKMESEFLVSDKSIRQDSSALELLRLYDAYANSFPSDTLAPEYLFKAGELCNGMEDYRKAVAYFEMYAENYPSEKRAADVIFLQGFIHENQFKNFEKARVLYESFLEKFPGHPLAKDIRIALANLGKTDEELIRDFEKKNAL
jgi:outer membrane protein assembly factor BamD (BamD/ComL family)